MNIGHLQQEKNIISLREHKYIKMYKDFYKNGRLNLSLDTQVTNNKNERRFVSNDGVYQVIKVVN